MKGDSLSSWAVELVDIQFCQTPSFDDRDPGEGGRKGGREGGRGQNYDGKAKSKESSECFLEYQYKQKYI